MKLKTIWTLKGMTFYERRLRTKEWLAMTVAAKLPQEVRYWATLMEIGKAVRKSPNIPATKLEAILRELEKEKNHG